MSLVNYIDSNQGETPMDITVQIKNVYGNEMIYPVCDKAKIFAALTGTKTLTREAVAKIKALGYSVSVQTPTL